MEQDDLARRRSEKDLAIAEIGVVLEVMRQQRRNPDHWERVHLVQAFAGFFHGLYLGATQEARIALAPHGSGVPHAELPIDPAMQRCDLPTLERIWNEARTEPVKPFPHFGRIVVR